VRRTRIAEGIVYPSSVVERNAEQVNVRRLEESDIDSLIDCVRRCYGESYPEADFYQPESVRRQLVDGQLLSGVAVARSGRVVGHIGARIPIPGDAVGETMGGFVDPEHRGLGLLRRIGRVLAAGFRERGIVGARHIATGTHDRTQRPIVASGGIATGVLLGHVPAGTDYRGIDHDFGSARIGAVVYYQAFGELPPLVVHPSPRYAERVATLRAAVGLERSIEPAPQAPGEPFAAAVRHDSACGVSTFRFGSIAWEGGEDAHALLAAELRHCGPVTYADVPLSDPRAASLIESLCGRGFFFGAWLPGTAASEALRLQRIEGAPVAPEKIVVASALGAELRGWIANVDRRQSPA
jgi:hypothetical protein